MVRALNFDEQEQRKKKVLQFLVHEYVRTGKPVASKSIAQSSRLGLSPASIRHVLFELERDEIVMHPHTSAGRVPTDKGYRMYVDSLIDLQRLAVQEETRIRSEYDRRIREIEDVLTHTSRILSSISHYTGFVMTPKFERNILSHLELIPIGERRVLVAMITESGLSKNFVINTQLNLSRERLYSIAKIMIASLKGLTLQEAQLKLVQSIESAEQEYREISSLAKEIGQEIRKFSDSELYMDGASNILSLPDFTNTTELHDLFRIMEEKQLLTNILTDEFSDAPANAEPKKQSKKKEHLPSTRAQATPHVHVRIGAEHPVKELQNLSLITTTYKLSDQTVGVLGILGPKRMEYSKMIALVDYISQMVNQFLEKHDSK